MSIVDRPVRQVDTEERQNGVQTKKKRNREGLADWNRLLDFDNCDSNDKNAYDIFLT